jgi:lactoylglutathione lyase
MNLNHVNLTVTDVTAAADFLETYFGMKKMGGNAGMAFLTDEQGFVLTLMKGKRVEGVAYPSTFHIGFFVAEDSTVDEVNRRLEEDGYEVSPPERHHAYGFYVQAPGGFTVELGS